MTHLNHYSLDTSFQKVVFIRCAIIAKGNSSPVAFGPARVLEKNGQNREAYSSYVKGKTIRASLSPFDMERQKTLFENIKKLFDDDRPVSQIEPTHYNAETQKNYGSPVFIVGMPRSGTTLAEQIISAHPDVRGVVSYYILQIWS